MSEHRKPPHEQSSRPEGAKLSSDTGGFSLETTQMRLKSLRVRRTEKAEAELEKKVAPAPSVESSGTDRPAGRVRHDERGMAVWDWAVATGEFATLSATHMMKKLAIEDLKVEEPSHPKLSIQPQGRDVGGGGDPYNQRGSGQRAGESAKRQGVTGNRDKAAVLDQLIGKKK